MPIASKKDATKRDGSLKAGYTMKTTDTGRVMYFIDPKKAKQLKEKEAKKLAALSGGGEAPVEPKKSVKSKSVKPKAVKPKVIKSSKEVTKSDSIESTIDSQLEDELE